MHDRKTAIAAGLGAMALTAAIEEFLDTGTLSDDAVVSMGNVARSLIAIADHHALSAAAE